MTTTVKKAVLLRGFDFGTSEADVRKHCAPYGKVVSVELKGKDKAVVTYGSEAQAQKAVINLDTSVIEGCKRYVDASLKDVEVKGAVAVKTDVRRAAAPKPKAVVRIAAAPTQVAGKTGSPQGVEVKVVGFDFGTTEQEVRKHCAKAGRVLAVELRGNGGLAVVTYATASQGQKAVDTLNQTVIDGNTRYIEVKMKGQQAVATPGAKQAAASTKISVGVSQQPKKRKAAPPSESCSVVVRGFDKGTSDETVVDHMSSAGLVVDSTIRPGKRMAIVTYSTPEEAQTAVETLNQSTIEGNTRYIEVFLDEEKTKAGDKAKPSAKKQKTQKGPSGPDLPRERLTEFPVAGTVVNWKGKFGWIKLAEDFDHPMASKHKGEIYVHIQDVLSGEPLTKDAEVQLYLFEDSSGLGAEEVSPMN